MSINIKCSACGRCLDSYEEAYCSDCVSHLEAKIEKLEDRIYELEK